MNADFGYVTDSLDGKEERVVTSQPAADRFPNTYVKVKAFVVAGQYLVPTAVNAHSFKTQKRNIHRNLHQAHAGAPDIKVSVSAAFTRTEYQSHQPHYNAGK